MKYQNIFYTIFFLKIIKLAFSSNQISPIIPVKRTLLTDDIKSLNFSKYLYLEIDSKGYGIIFNNTSNISLIPYNLFNYIFYSYRQLEDVNPTIKKYENNIQEIIINTNDFYGFQIIHFILENISISIPLKYFLVKKNIKIEEDKEPEYGICFLSRENQEYIIFGKDLLEIMNIEFKENNNIIIHNDEFIYNFEE